MVGLENEFVSVGFKNNGREFAEPGKNDDGVVGLGNEFAVVGFKNSGGEFVGFEGNG